MDHTGPAERPVYALEDRDYIRTANRWFSGGLNPLLI